jgi:hypothetical protein
VEGGRNHAEAPRFYQSELRQTSTNEKNKRTHMVFCDLERQARNKLIHTHHNSDNERGLWTDDVDMKPRLVGCEIIGRID